MLIIHSDAHRVHAPKRELSGGDFMIAVETPQRADAILAAVKAAGIGPIEEPETFGLDAILAVHSEAYVSFLVHCYEEWAAEYPSRDALPLIWPVKGLRRRVPESIDGRLGYYCADAGTPVTAGSWVAARAGAEISLTATNAILEGAPAAYALSRPPGHHASADMMCGYCYLNNAAIAAQHALDRGAARVAILDVDYHHGNGTQDIFYARDDVLVVSIHADPDQEYPYFLGFADETGQGAGEGFTLNLPLPWGTNWQTYAAALDRAVSRIEAFRPDLLVVSFGADTYKGDPISRFELEELDFAPMGGMIGQLGLSTIVIQEGGYAVDALGRNVVNFLTGLQGDE
ncbi:MAG: histone deacetylase family protein [Pseudomonadota bacterium]